MQTDANNSPSYVTKCGGRAETDEIFPHILHLEAGVFVQNIAEPMLNMGVLGRLRRLRFGERQAGDYKFFKKYLRNHLTNGRAYAKICLVVCVGCAVITESEVNDRWRH